MLKRGFKSKSENISLQVRSELGLGKNEPLPPHLLAEHIGVQLWKPIDIAGLSENALRQLLRRDRDSWSAVTISFGGVDVVIYNSSHSQARQSSDIMHELSHILLGHNPIEMMLFSQSEEIVLREYDQTLEEEANWLSGSLLLPREALLHISRNRINNADACRIYGVSNDLLDYRINITGVNVQVGLYK